MLVIYGSNKRTYKSNLKTKLKMEKKRETNIRTQGSTMIGMLLINLASTFQIECTLLDQIKN
jgi:hypothetical protein